MKILALQVLKTQVLIRGLLLYRRPGQRIFAFSCHLIGRLSRIKTAWLECHVLRNKQRHMTSLV